MQAARRHVPEHAGDELVHVQGQRLELPIAVVEVAHAHGVAVQVEAMVGAQRAAASVACEVQHDATAVCVGRTDLDVPVLAVQPPDVLEPGGEVGAGRQRPVAATQFMQHVVQQLAAQQALQGGDGQQPAWTALTPKAVVIEAAGGDQAVHVRVVRQGAAPGVQRQQHARHHAEEARVAHDLQQGLAHALQQQGGEGGAVVGPQGDQLVRQGEDDVEVRAGQQPLQFSVDPFVASGLGAAGATAMAAGVELQLLAGAGGTGQDMSAHGARAAAGDASRGTPLLHAQPMRGGVLGQMPLEDLLLGHAHGSTAKSAVPAAYTSGVSHW